MKRRQFNTKEEWADYAVRVLRRNHGLIQLNRYSWRSGARLLEHALQHACQLGLAKGNPRSHFAAYEYRLTEKGEQWRFPKEQEASPLYCDTCGDELQRESCNHVRGCVKCLEAAQAKVREETLRDVLLIVKAEYHSHEASSMSNVSCWENQHTARIERKIKTLIPTPAQEQSNG